MAGTYSTVCALSMDRIIESMRALVAVDILSHGGASALESMMCDGRRQLLEATVRDAFVECAMSLTAAISDIDIDGLRLTVVTGREADTRRLLAVSRAFEQMVIAATVHRWAATAGHERLSAESGVLRDEWRRQLSGLLSSGVGLRPPFV